MDKQNSREEARVIIKKIVDFNIVNNYYQKDLKDELARDFKKLLYVDNPTVRKFLEKWIESTKQLALEFDLLGTEIEVDKAEAEKEESEEEIEEKIESEEEEIEEKEKEEKNKEETEEENKEKVEKVKEVPLENTIHDTYYSLYLERASRLTDDLLDG